MPELTSDVRKIHQAGYNVQRRSEWLCAIVSSETGETILKVILLPNTAVVINEKTFTCSEKVHLTLRDGRPVAECEGALVFANEIV